MRLAAPVLFPAPMLRLGKPGGNAAQQHAHQQHDIEHHEHRYAIAGRHAGLDRREGIEIDHDEMPVGEGEDNQSQT
ncbi:hypothetical protein D3C72_2308800 [compost metagenome]